MNGTAFFKDCNLKLRLFIYIIYAMAIGAIIYYVCLASYNTGEAILKSAVKLEFQGSVDSVYFDEMNHNTKTALLSNGYKYEIYPEWGSMIDLGDSLNKEKGLLKVKVFKRNGRSVILDYKTLVKNYK